MGERTEQKASRIFVVGGVGALMAVIREIAKDTSKVFFTDHAVKRLRERGLADKDVFRVLKLGDIQDRVWLEDDGCKVVLVQRGDRALGVVTILIEEDAELVVKTVEWEDWK